MMAEAAAEFTAPPVETRAGKTVQLRNIHAGIGRDSRSDLYEDRLAYVWDNDGDTAPCATTTVASSTPSAGTPRPLTLHST
jgi:hypothetical protein